jgi:hypothetical protein
MALMKIEEVLRQSLLKSSDVIGCDDCVGWMMRYEALQDELIRVIKDNLTLHRQLELEREHVMALRALASWRPEKQHG